jgi:NADH:ubiquinone oxidoreductase subunit 4 (subunit M)
LRVSGLAKEAPWLTAAIVAGALSAMAAPGTSAGWLPIMSTFGALPRGVGAALGVVVATAILAVALGRAAVRLASGSPRRELATSPLLEPFGGRVPDLDAKGTLSALALALLLLIFGVHPAPLVTMSHVSVNELGAVLNPPGPGEIARR